MKVRHKQTGAVYLLRDVEHRHSQDPRTTETTMEVEDAVGEVRQFVRTIMDYIDEPVPPEPRWQDVTGECAVKQGIESPACPEIKYSHLFLGDAQKPFARLQYFGDDVYRLRKVQLWENFKGAACSEHWAFLIEHKCP